MAEDQNQKAPGLIIEGAGCVDPFSSFHGDICFAVQIFFDYMS